MGGTILGATVVAGCAALGFFCTPVRGDVIYVDDDAAPGGNGAAWQTAYRYLQDALAVASAGDEIRVAGGIYRPDQSEYGHASPGDRSATFQLASGVALYGGYAGLAGADPDVRDVSLYEAVLSGDLAGDDGPDFANYGENSYHVLTGSGTNATAVLDGFAITGGNADSDAFYDGVGAGMFSVAGSPTVIGCIFRYGKGRHSAGAIYNEDYASPYVADCVFVGNVQSGPSPYTGSGAIDSTDNCSPTLVNCTFADNVGRGGGALGKYIGCDAVVTGCVFTNNTAVSPQGSGWGGAVFNLDSTVTLAGCTFSGNQATGALYPKGGALYSRNGATRVADCTFVDNSSNYDGGAVYGESQDSSMLLVNCSFGANWARRSGAVSAYQSCTFTDCVFTENEAADDGGAVYAPAPCTWERCDFFANRASDQGGALFLSAGPGVGLDCIFIAKHAREGGAVRTQTTWDTNRCLFSGNVADEDGGACYSTRSVTPRNCVFAGNMAGDDGGGFWASFGVTVEGGVIAGNLAGDDGGGAVVASGVRAENCTVVANRANDYAGGLLLGGADVDNAILWANQDGQYGQGERAQYGGGGLSYSCVQGWTGTMGGVGNFGSPPAFREWPGGTWTAGGVYDADTHTVTLVDAGASWPENELVNLLVNPDTGQVLCFPIVANTSTTLTIWADWPTVSAGASWITAGMSYELLDFHLTASSPCIDAGNPAGSYGGRRDLDGRLRVWDGNGDDVARVDMGAYEFGSFLAGDLTCDGAVGADDVSAFIMALIDPGGYAATYTDCERTLADVNGDGLVNAGDIPAFVDLLTGG